MSDTPSPILTQHPQPPLLCLNRIVTVSQVLALIMSRQSLSRVRLGFNAWWPLRYPSEAAMEKPETLGGLRLEFWVNDGSWRPWRGALLCIATQRFHDILFIGDCCFHRTPA